MRISRVLLPVALLVTPFVFGAPQQRETTTVEVVQVPVYVTRAGNSVRGLTRDAFTLRVNGRPQEIAYFDVVDFAALSPDQSRDPRQRRLYVLLFDLVNSQPFSIIRARIAMESYLAAAQPSDYFAVALLNRRNGVDFVVPFTRDKAVLRRAVTSFSASSPADPLRLTVAPADQVALMNNNRSEIDELRRLGAGVAVELGNEAARSDVVDQFESLGRLAERMAPMEGYKHVVVLSNGFSGSLVMGERRPSTAANSLRVGPAPELASLRPMGQPSTFAPEFVDSRIPAEQRRMQRKFVNAGVFLDAIDLSGVRPFDQLSNDGLHIMAADTGGQVVEHRNDLNAAMQHLADSQQVVYVLGFHAPDTGRRQNAISVHVDGAPGGSRVAYREEYTSIAGKPSSGDGLRLADIVINDIPQNGMTMTASVTVAPRRAGLNLVLPGRELLAIADDAPRIEGEALIYVFAGQTSVAFARKGIDVDVARARTSGLDGGNVEIAHSFDLPPGRYAMRVLVRLDGHDTLAFARQDFVVKE